LYCKANILAAVGPLKPGISGDINRRSPPAIFLAMNLLRLSLARIPTQLLMLSCIFASTLVFLSLRLYLALRRATARYVYPSG
jgi:hypothetical protein